MEPDSASSSPPPAPSAGDTSGDDPSAGRPEALQAQRLESLGRLAGGAAHDVNNVLGVVLGYVELARMGLGDEHPKLAYYLEQALKTVDRARELTDGLLGAARKEARAPDVCCPEPVVRAACDLMTRSLDPRVRLAADVAADAPVVPLDATALQQVVLNLLIHAAEAQPEGGRIDVSLAAAAVEPGSALAPGTYAVLRVDDAGPDVAALRPGAGLPVVRTLVERFGGRVEQDAGAIRVWLPHALAARGAVEPAPPGGAVLVVDGDADVRAVLRSHLESEGRSVEEAGDAAEAAAALARGGIALVLTDARLTDATGADLLWQAARGTPAPRGVLLGGDGAESLPHGAARLPKPFLRGDLLRVLGEVSEGAPG